MIDGYCGFVSNYTDLALIGFGISTSNKNADLSGNFVNSNEEQGSSIINVQNPIVVGGVNNQNPAQPAYPTILQYIGRTFGSETLNSGTAGTCQNMVVTGPGTYYLNYAILDDQNNDTFLRSDLSIYPLLSATRLN
jgi:hypothetical protein